ncbi:hypothetical protein Pcinc_020741 [Petrolisthes cinctipes]|uniref:Carbohydrate sulfotransferase n=1 Tax=Petrolisthes cinctipes TaxID=88211 RepID=A0AAE1KJD1_PETCI|nr:hypothetical protein Pcinc_020741 [Petrolisthes cinctipes]
MTFTVNRELPFSSHHTHVLDKEAVAERFRQRQARVEYVCRGKPHWTLPKTLRDWIFYAPKHNILVCITPKIASSTWLTHLIHLRGLYPNVTNFHTNFWRNKIKGRVLLGTKEMRRRFNNSSSVTIMTVRHPLSRLVSAFKDKFRDGNELVKATHPKKYKLFWLPALRSLGKRKKAPIQFTFAEFLQFALYTRPNDRHWRSVGQVCSPCGLSYQYILMLETFNQDLAYLAMTLNITRAISIHKHKNKKGEGTTDDTRITGPTDHLSLDPAYLKYYLQLPPRLLANVIKKYKLDLDLFGYKIPPALVNRTRI